MQKIMQIAAAIDQMIYEMFAISWAMEHSLLFEQCKSTIYNPVIWTRNTA